MAKRNMNVVCLTGNLTRDPELRSIPSGTSVCSLGLAVNESYKDGGSGEWKERANFFEITVWGAQGEACAQYLAKGRPVAVMGRLRYESWTDQQSGGKRSKVTIVADMVQFLGSRDGGDGGGGGREFDPEPGGNQQPGGEVPADTADLSGGAADPASAYAGKGGPDDDIPF